MKTNIVDALLPTHAEMQAKTVSLLKSKRKVQQPNLKFNFRAEMTKQQRQVLEAFDMYGDGNGDDLAVDQAISEDWVHLIVAEVADLLQLLKRESADPSVVKNVVRELATIAAACEMWAKQLAAE